MNKPFVPEPMIPWAPPLAPILDPQPLDGDPRTDLGDRALALASTNAFPVVARQKARRDSMGLVAGAAIAVVLGSATFISLSSKRNAAGPVVATAAPGSVAPQSHQHPLALAPGNTAPAMSPTHNQPAMLEGQPMPAPAPMPMHHDMANMAGMPGSVRMAPGASPVVVFDGGNAAISSNSGRPVTPAAAGGSSAMLGAAAIGLQGLTASDASSARSTRISEPANTVIQGTLIPAVLETAINSDLPGFARAVVSQDVRSFDGSKVLIPRSSRLIGEYKAGQTAGQKRTYLLWTRLVRPDGVSIALASPAVGFSGESGVGGKVNSHFFERFGSALLMSVLGGAGNILSSGATVVVAGGQNAASMGAQHDGQRAPTVRVRQGEPIRVFTARDLIFSPGNGAAG